MNTPNWAFWSKVPQVTLWQAVLLSLDVEPADSDANFSKVGDRAEAARRLQLICNDRGNRRYFSPEVSRTEDPRFDYVNLPDFVRWAVEAANWPDLPSRFLEIDCQPKGPVKNGEPAEGTVTGDSLPQVEPGKLIAWYDRSMVADDLFKKSNLPAEAAAKALCRIEKSEGNPEQVFVDGQASAPDRYRRLLELFSQVEAEAPHRHRTLMDWRAIARLRRQSYHPWIDDYRKAKGIEEVAWALECEDSDRRRQEKRSAGRYTLREAAQELAGKSGWAEQRWLELLEQQVQAGVLPLRNPLDLADALPYEVPHVLRDHHDQVCRSDVNQWLAANPGWGEYRLEDSRVATPMPSEALASEKSSEETEEGEISGGPSLSPGRNARADMEAWVQYVAGQLLKEEDTGHRLATRIRLLAEKHGYKSERKALTTSSVVKMLPAGITGGRAKNGKKQEKQTGPFRTMKASS